MLEESLPQVLMDKYRLMGRQEAVRAMHFPKDLAEYKQALRRTKFEELFYFQMNLQAVSYTHLDVYKRQGLTFQPNHRLKNVKLITVTSLTQPTQR